MRNGAWSTAHRRAYAYEALARAHALAGHLEAAKWKSKARAAGAAIADPQERAHFDEDFATLL
jgi:hypothetical protein